MRLRPLVLLFCALSISSCAGPPGATAPEALGERMASLVEQYDAQGHHRTGTEVDRATAQWLAALAEEEGFDARLVPFPFERTEVREARVELADGRRFEGYPLLDSPFTGPEGVEGTLGALVPTAEVAVFRSPPIPGFLRDFTQARRANYQRALLMVTGGEPWQLPDGLVLMNAERYGERFGPPVLQLPTQAWDALESQLGQPIRVITDGDRIPGEALNVVVTAPGARPELKPIVVMTPRSGWWECASERGGGIALWIEMVRALGAEAPDRTVHFLATTGHELGQLGLDRFLSEDESLVREAHLWIHLGDSFAAADAELRLQASEEEMLERARERLTAAGAEPVHTTPVGNRPLGEVRRIYDRGGRYLSILSVKNEHFHSPSDRWPEAVDSEALIRIGRAMLEILLQEGRAAD